MITLIIGAIATLLIFILSIGKESWAVYLQYHSIVVVAGGTFTILIFSNPIRVLKSLWEAIVDLFRKDLGFEFYEPELIELAKNQQRASRSNQEMIRYASSLWSQGVDPELFIVLISQKRRELESRGHDAIQALKNLAKYPPALGMTGTVMGMVALFSVLDQNKDKIGSHLSVAMTATFIGLVLANGLISPLADRLNARYISQQRLFDSIYEILLLINRGEAFSVIQDEVTDRAA